MTFYSRRSALQLGGLSALAAAGCVAPSSASASSLAPASRLGTGTRYGINASTAKDVQSRLRTFGSVGIARTFYSGMLPATWNKYMEGASPARATQVSFKTSPAALASGAHDKVLRSWMESIPSGWRVYLTFWHEPNDELRAGVFSGQEYRRAWAHLSRIRRTQVNLRKDVRLRLVPVFMSYLVGKPSDWSNGWVPTPDEVAFVSWDIYGNPSGGDGLRGRYPAPAAGIDPCLRVSSTLGFKNWGVTEFNTPQRDWDRNEHMRTAWLSGFRHHCMDAKRGTARKLGPPKILLLWEGVGSNWDQRFTTKATRQWWTSACR